LLKARQTVCQRQIDVLKAALGETQHGIEFNNRVPQPLNHRVVSHRHCEASTTTLHWVYANDGETEANAMVQAQTWGGLCATGREQSPIDVVTSAVVVGNAPPAIETRFSAALEFVKNTGHGWQLFETSPASHELNEDGEVHVMAEGQPKGYSMINGAKYNFYQVHWHTPSENTVDGESFPLEAHFVHQLDDPALVGGYHRLAVIGLLYELGECNTFLDYFWDRFPRNKGTEEYDGEALDFNAKLSAALAEGYYHWFGSLTTPPCTEGVSWNLLKARQTVCQRQVDVLKAALAATQHGLDFNNRVPQPLNHRVVRLNGVVPAEPTEPTEPTTAPTVPTSAAPTVMSLPPCSEITDPFQPCQPDSDVESGAAVSMLALFALAHFA
jgi:carbonic anhydrase